MWANKNKYIPESYFQASNFSFHFIAKFLEKIVQPGRLKATIQRYFRYDAGSRTLSINGGRSSRYHLADAYLLSRSSLTVFRLTNRFPDMASNGIWTRREMQDLQDEFHALPEDLCNPARDSIYETEEFDCKGIISQQELDQMVISLRMSEDDRGYEDDSDFTSESSQSQKSFTFKVEKQKRPGAHHGLGGRPRALNGYEHQRSIGPQIAKKVCRLLLSRAKNRIAELANGLKDTFIRILREDQTANYFQIPQDYVEILDAEVKRILNVKDQSGYECVSAPFISVCYKAPRFASANLTSRSAIDMHAARHAACTWLDQYGYVHCTCLGSTMYRITMHSTDRIKRISCVHGHGFNRILSAVASSFKVSVETAGKILARFFIPEVDYVYQTYLNSLPRMHSLHKGSILVVAGVENPSDSRSVMFVPVRHITKGLVRNACAFCDNVLHGSCHHTRAISILEENESDISEEKSHATFPSLEDDEEECLRSVSVLPLSPMNCARSLEVDHAISNLARASQAYLITAPLTCSACGSERNEVTRKVWNNGVVMCTVGPCKVTIEEYRCSSNSCSRTIVSEGRDHCVLIHTMASCATHAFLRRELYGVVISNGTLTGRLSHYHSLVTANIFFGIIPSHPPCRSVKTLIRLCSIMLRLMCINPPKSVFRCDLCEFDNDNLRPRLQSLCMDGISQGFLKTGAKPFKNISEPCVALKPSTATSRGRADSLMRPLTCLVRENRPVKILLDAIHGKNLICTKSTEKDFACAIRMVSDCALPAEFCSSISVCGRSRGDVSNDVGPHSVLRHIRELVTSLFDEKTILYRLIAPLRDSVHDAHVRTHLDTLHSAADRMNSSTSSCQTCWKMEIPDINGCRARNDLLNLFRMIIQGPVLQFVKKSDTTSLRALSRLCCARSVNDLEHALRNPDVLLEGGNPGDRNILKSLKVLRAGVFSTTEMERSNGVSVLRHNIGSILRDCNSLVLRFYAFYDNPGRPETAFEYRRRWSCTGSNELEKKMMGRYGFPNSDFILLAGNEHELAIRTGAYFPGRSQLRPLPFNDEQLTGTAFESIESCSKDYLQRQKSFTPGALTFSCSCSHPKILGFKVLFGNEGPRAILDTVLSRFAVLPNFLIYDFCCGLFLCAIHCLWWAFSDTSIVCDNFHTKNHSCSPGYFPKSHFDLSNANTVAHEQRNRAIARLGLSLRNCNQNLYVSLLAYQTIVLNVRAKAKGTQLYENRAKTFSAFDVEWCFFHFLQIKCTCC